MLLLALLDGTGQPQPVASCCVFMMKPALPMGQVLPDREGSGSTLGAGREVTGITAQHLVNAVCIPDFCFLPLFQASSVTVVSVPFNKNSGRLESLGKE